MPSLALRVSAHGKWHVQATRRFFSLFPTVGDCSDGRNNPTPCRSLSVDHSGTISCPKTHRKSLLTTYCTSGLGDRLTSPASSETTSKLKENLPKSSRIPPRDARIKSPLSNLSKTSKNKTNLMPKLSKPSAPFIAKIQPLLGQGLAPKHLSAVYYLP